jgi:hypothetical protein
LFVGFGDIKVWYLGTHVVRGHCVGVDFSRPTDPLFGVGKSGAAAKTLMSSAESKERGLQNKLRRDFISSMET